MKTWRNYWPKWACKKESAGLASGAFFVNIPATDIVLSVLYTLFMATNNGYTNRRDKVLAFLSARSEKYGVCSWKDIQTHFEVSPGLAKHMEEHWSLGVFFQGLAQARQIEKTKHGYKTL